MGNQQTVQTDSESDQVIKVITSPKRSADQHQNPNSSTLNDQTELSSPLLFRQPCFLKIISLSFGKTNQIIPLCIKESRVQHEQAQGQFSNSPVSPHSNQFKLTNVKKYGVLKEYSLKHPDQKESFIDLLEKYENISQQFDMSLLPIVEKSQSLKKKPTFKKQSEIIDQRGAIQTKAETQFYKKLSFSEKQFLSKDLSDTMKETGTDKVKLLFEYFQDNLFLEMFHENIYPQKDSKDQKTKSECFSAQIFDEKRLIGFLNSISQTLSELLKVRIPVYELMPYHIFLSQELNIQKKETQIALGLPLLLSDHKGLRDQEEEARARSNIFQKFFFISKTGQQPSSFKKLFGELFSDGKRLDLKLECLMSLKIILSSPQKLNYECPNRDKYHDKLYSLERNNLFSLGMTVVILMYKSIRNSMASRSSDQFVQNEHLFFGDGKGQVDESEGWNLPISQEQMRKQSIDTFINCRQQFIERVLFLAKKKMKNGFSMFSTPSYLLKLGIQNEFESVLTIIKKMTELRDQQHQLGRQSMGYEEVHVACQSILQDMLKEQNAFKNQIPEFETEYLEGQYPLRGVNEVQSTLLLQRFRLMVEELRENDIDNERLMSHLNSARNINIQAESQDSESLTQQKKPRIINLSIQTDSANLEDTELQSKPGELDGQPIVKDSQGASATGNPKKPKPKGIKVHMNQ